MGFKIICDVVKECICCVGVKIKVDFLFII